MIISFPLQQIRMAGAKLKGLIGSYYRVAYSGGTLQQPGSTIPYWLYNSNTYGADQQESSVICSGAITATFTWVPDYPNEPPPSQALLYQQADAWAGGDAQASASADDGLGDPEVVIPGGGANVYSEGVHFKVVHPGPVLTIETDPSAEAQDMATGLAWAGVAYSASLTPITVNLAGTTQGPGGPGDLNILIGQCCTPSLSCPCPEAAVTFQNITWTVAGDTFKDYDEFGPAGYGPISWVTYAQVDPMAATDWYQADQKSPAPKWAWKSEDNATSPGASSSIDAVSATADVLVNGAKVDTASPATQVQMWQPDYTCVVPTPGGAAIKQADNPLKVVLQTGTYVDPQSPDEPGSDQDPAPAGSVPGIQWTGTVTPPGLFNSLGRGQWTFVQTNMSVVFETQTDLVDGEQVPVLYTWSQVLRGLDTSYPYGFPETATQQAAATVPDDGNKYTSEDSPGVVLEDNMTIVNITDFFSCYMMYLPPDVGQGHQWVPLNRVDWSWGDLTVVNPGTWEQLLGVPQVGPSVGANVRCINHPTWKLLNTEAGGTWVPVPVD